MKRHLLIWGITLLSSAANAALDQESEAAVQKLIQAFKNNDITQISQLVSYPLARELPLKPIRSPQEFQQRFDQIFDESLRQRIASSHLADWDQVGWRGIMFDTGDVWLNEAGQITAVNAQSPKETQLIQAALAQEKQALHPSLRNYDEPMLKIQTSQYVVRIDRIGERYRYAAWKRGISPAQKPDLVLNNGRLDVLGTARNEHYQFKSGPYTYEVWRNIVGERDVPAELKVYKNSKVVLEQDAELID